MSAVNDIIVQVQGTAFKGENAWKLVLQLRQGSTITQPSPEAASTMVLLKDEFEEWYTKLQRYIDKHSSESPFETEKACRIQMDVHAFREKLYDTIIESEMGHTLSRVKVDTVTVEAKGGEVPVAEDIFTIPGEFLDDTPSHGRINFTVRRSVPLNSPQDHPKYLQPSSTLKVLFVVAGDLRNERDINHQDHIMKPWGGGPTPERAGHHSACPRGP